MRYGQFVEPDEPGVAASPRTTTAVLRQRTFGLWFLGNLANNSGTWLYNVAAAVVVYNLTRSALQVGLVSIAQYVPLAVLSPWAGALSDRLDRRKLLLASQVFSASCATAFAVVVMITGTAGLPGTWPVILTSAGIGLGMAFAAPPMQALVPALVDPDDLDVAVTLTSLTFNVGRALGPAAAGVVIFTLGVEAAFAVNAATFAVLILVLAVIRPRPRPPGAGGDRSVRAGLVYVWRDATMLRLLVAVGAVGFASDPIATLAPPLAEAVGGGERLVAFLVSSFGLAAATVALLGARIYRRYPLPSAGRAGCLVLVTGLAVAAVAPTAPVALAGFAVMGAGYLLGLNSFTALLQRRVPDALRGRVMALWTVAFLGSRPLAALADGAVADLFGVRPAFAVAVAAALTAAFVTRKLAVTGVTAS